MGAKGSSLVSQPASAGTSASRRFTMRRAILVLAWPRSPRKTMSCPERSAFSTWGRTESSYPMMPGKSGTPALRRVTRLSLSSCLTDLPVYPLARSSPTVLGLVTRTLCRDVPNLSIATASRRQQVTEEEHAELDEKEFVPRRHGLQRLARVGDLVGEDGGERALGQAHGAHHELRGNLAPRPVFAMAVGERYGEAVVHEAVGDGHLRRLAEPAAEAVTTSLDAGAIRRAVLAEEELCGVGELQEVL